MAGVLWDQSPRFAIERRFRTDGKAYRKVRRYPLVYKI